MKNIVGPKFPTANEIADEKLGKVTGGENIPGIPSMPSDYEVEWKSDPNKGTDPASVTDVGEYKIQWK